jgi:dipeptidyl aminopeptidase/acylaminoacyl peptidase
MTNTRSLLIAAFALGPGAFSLWPAALGPGPLALNRATAQQPPATEVYVASLEIAGGRAKAGAPVNISRNAGYDNQPSFLPNSSAILFSSNRDGKQTDIYRYDIAAKQVTQLTKTEDNEYSPLVTPDGRTFSSVRGQKQLLWRYNLDGSDAGGIVEAPFLVGYHVWIDATHLAMFVLSTSQGEPNTMRVWDTTTKTDEIVAKSIGRSLLMRPKTGTVSFMTSVKGEPSVVKAFDPRTKAIATLGPALEGSQDAAWLADGRLVMARDLTLHVWSPGATAWTELLTFTPGADAFNRITRMAISPDGKWIAFVAEPKTSEADHLERQRRP